MHALYKDLTFSDDDYLIDELRDLGYDMDDDDLGSLDFRDPDYGDYNEDAPDIILDVPYVPSDEKIVYAMLDLAQVNSQDILYDLGCGDGRIVVAAAMERNTRGVGIDIDPMRITEAIEYAGHSGVEHLTHFFEGDLLDVDFSDATVVTLYLLDLINLELRPRLLDELRPGTRIVSHAFDMGDWKADQRQSCGSINIYQWIIPAKVAGIWEWLSTDGNTYRVELKQKYQRVTGKVWINGQSAQLSRALLQADLLELIIKPENSNQHLRFLMRCEPRQWTAAEGDTLTGPAVKVLTA